MRTHAIFRPRSHKGAPAGIPYGFRELRLIYPRQLIRAFALAVALHLSAIGIGSVVVSLREPPHPGSGGGRVSLRDTIRVEFMPAPPPLIHVAEASPGEIGPMVPPNVEAAMPVPVPDLDVPEHVTIPTPDQWNSLLPSALPNDGSRSGDTLIFPTSSAEQFPAPGVYVAVEEMPVLVSMPRVEYPAIAREAGMQGTVVVHALVGKDGTVRETRLVKRVHPLLDESAQRAVSGALFKPAIQAGRPVPVWAAVPVAFRLN